MLEILYSTGMRKGELVALNVADFSFERQEIVIVTSKSRKGRMVPVGEYARRFTEAYLRAVRPWLARNDEEKALFVSVRSGRRLAVRTVGQIVGRAARMSGVAKTITPHTFRFATRWPPRCSVTTRTSAKSRRSWATRVSPAQSSTPTSHWRT